MRTGVPFWNTRATQISVLFGPILWFFLFSGILACPTQETKDPGSSDNTSVENEREVIDWLDANPARFLGGVHSNLKYHRVIDWGAYKRWYREHASKDMKHRKLINWKQLGNSSSNMAESSSDQQEHNASQNGETVPELTAVSDSKQQADPYERSGNKNEVNRRAIDGSTTIDWRTKKEQHRSTDRRASTSSVQTSAVVKTKPERDHSASEARAIYLNEIDWRRVPEN